MTEEKKKAITSYAGVASDIRKKVFLVFPIPFDFMERKLFSRYQRTGRKSLMPEAEAS